MSETGDIRSSNSGRIDPTLSPTNGTIDDQESGTSSTYSPISDSMSMPNSTRSSDRDDESMEEESSEENASDSVKTFDRRLPIVHSYLGNTGQGELTSESIFEEAGNKIKIPVLIIKDICLLPGQTMPLQFHTQPSVQFLNDTNHQQSLFALLTAEKETEFQDADDFSRIKCHPIGTLFQIQNASKKREDDMTIQVVGRQRCTLIAQLNRHSIHCEDYSTVICDKVEVEVLEDQLLPKQIIQAPECSFNRLPRNERLKWFASLSPYSMFVLKQSSTEGLVRKLMKWLLYWFKQRQIDLVIEQGLAIFSFWVAANIPMSVENKLELLGENSTDRRLRTEWRIVSQMSSIVCIACDDAKCDVSSIINLSVEGNSTHFVNPGGFVHDLFTVSHLKNIELRGEPSNEFSWFPGYEWCIIECSNCFHHIGWHFTSKNLSPRKFYGISRRSFRLKEPNTF